ncbi:hypothetical protein B9Z19DRAFT_1083075 [Tuber borchii]|uniref:Uncharacterized protein n=1 Tax=Tuber borchii TaxID=42251 RepID=A0A2T6ZTM4_TUBBO|nr:hypothetical protein B9Z19DRAFT_1083075 [Tuber borchii]
MKKRYSSRVSRRGRMMAVVSLGGTTGGGGAGRREDASVGFRGRGGIATLALVLVLGVGLKEQGLMVTGFWVGYRRRWWLWRGHCRRRWLRKRRLW